MHMRGGTVPKDWVQTDKPRRASCSFCLHSKRVLCTCSREFPPLHLWRIVPCHLSCKSWKSPCVDEFVSFIFSTRSLNYEFTENVKSNMLKTSRFCHMWNVLSYTSSLTVSCCFTSESIKELWTKGHNLLVNSVF